MDIDYEIAPEAVELVDWPTVLDVRPALSSSPGLPGATRVQLEAVLEDPARWVSDRRTLVVCDVGVRSGRAVQSLHEAGFTASRSLAGGIDAWRRLGLPLDGTAGLGRNDLDRYDRQMKLPDIGAVGQGRIGAATVAVVGAGGLGSPLISYLAGAGVGTLRIIDSDVVDLVNLHRQPIYRTDEVGTEKASAAARHVAALNPSVRVSPLPVRLDATNAEDLLFGADVVADATDNATTRQVVNAACVALRIPLVTAAAYRWEGQLSVYEPGGPCYRCVFPTAPGEDRDLECAVAGIAGPVVGVLGSMQATEVLKILTGAGENVSRRLLIFDGATGSVTTVRVGVCPDCPVCSGGDPAG